MSCTTLRTSKILNLANAQLADEARAWKIFNVRTRMMKGLFNYKTAFRTYTRLFLEYLVDQRIQYAEIRPNFMNTNQLWSDNGMERLNNEHIMTILIREYEKFQKDTDNALSGLKVIYCTPRSFEKGQVQLSLNECLAFKIRWPEWIAGELSIL